MYPIGALSVSLKRLSAYTPLTFTIFQNLTINSRNDTVPADRSLKEDVLIAAMVFSENKWKLFGALLALERHFNYIAFFCLVEGNYIFPFSSFHFSIIGKCKFFCFFCNPIISY